MNTLKALACIAVLTAATAAMADHKSSPLQPFPGTDNIPGVDDRSELSRFTNSLKIEVDTSGLDAGSPYTIWAVIFNSPQHCQTKPCSADDLPISPGHDPRVEASIVFAAGGLANLDGTGRFLGRVRKHAHRVLGELIVGNGSLDTRKAEVHVVVRGHGYPAPDKLFDALNSFAGGCDAGNVCEDQQFAIHLPKAHQ